MAVHFFNTGHFLAEGIKAAEGLYGHLGWAAQLFPYMRR
jgi:hypothetical protein